MTRSGKRGRTRSVHIA